ncbi:MAG TPA: DUF2182 domain-containing protein [Actinomycetota bacterium]|nr:DUF2182 domain-containing protein [Actinomycetota bacterium]
MATAGREGPAEHRPEPQSRTWASVPLTVSVFVILATLLGVSALAWALTLRQGMGGDMLVGLTSSLSRASEGMHPEMGMGMAMGAPLFVGMWATMMVAMMFPSVAPMVLAHWRLSAGRRQGPLAVPLFVGGYLVSWTAIGVAAYGAYRGLLALAPTLSGRAAGMVAGATLTGAGVYQLSRFKTVCLSHCRSPVQFFLHWRPGLAGALRMGVGHGFYCVGCCWGLMLVLFVVGVMNLVWMGVLAAVIFVEKVAPFGWRMAKGVGVALIAAGLGVALFPAVLGTGLLGG